MEQQPERRQPRFSLLAVLSGEADAAARIYGSEEYPRISGLVQFYQTDAGTLVRAVISGLPYEREACRERILGFHIHEGAACAGNKTDPFSAVGSHYNPGNCRHPFHAGDLPPLFGNRGLALSAFLTDRFRVQEIIGKTIIIHEGPDDFFTDPAGKAGKKIACGMIGASGSRF